MDLLNIERLLNFAIRLEGEAVQFYLEWAGKSDLPELQRIFKLLAEEETQHKKTFETLRTHSKRVVHIDDEDEYDEYFRTFSEDVMHQEEEAASVRSLKEAIDLAKKQEVDSQLFYADLAKFLALEHRETMRKIITEESLHFDKLVKLEQQLFKKSSV